MSSAAVGINKVRTEDGPFDLATWRSLMTLIKAFDLALGALEVKAKREPNVLNNSHYLPGRNLQVV